MKIFLRSLKSTVNFSALFLVALKMSTFTFCYKTRQHTRKWFKACSWRNNSRSGIELFIDKLSKWRNIESKNCALKRLKKKFEIGTWMRDIRQTNIVSWEWKNKLSFGRWASIIKNFSFFCFNFVLTFTKVKIPCFGYYLNSNLKNK